MKFGGKYLRKMIEVGQNIHNKFKKFKYLIQQKNP